MKLSTKVIIVIAVVIALAGAGLFVQRTASKSVGYNMTAQDMKLLFPAILGPQELQMAARNPEQKKSQINSIRSVLALAQAAEREGLADTPEAQAIISFYTDKELAQRYFEKNKDAEVTDEQVAAYYQSNPDDFDRLVQIDSEIASANAQSPGGARGFLAQVRLLAERARNEGFDQDETVRVLLRFARASALQEVYANKLIMPEIEPYYNDHKDEFEQARVRHILFVPDFQPAEGADEDDPKVKEANDKARAEAMTKARQEAQAVLSEIRNGGDFAKLAEQHSDDPNSKSRGGDFGYIWKGGDSPFVKAAFEIEQGKVSDVIEAPYGFHILMVEERRLAPVTNPMVRQKIIGTYDQNRRQEFSKRLQAEVAQIMESSGVQVAEQFEFQAPPVQEPAFPPGMMPPGGPAQPQQPQER
jgi:parvulin-like peptidyl-prolyl isomerase